MADSFQDQLVDFIAGSLVNADEAFVEDFIKGDPMDGGEDAACRYLLAIALHSFNPTEFARFTNVSVPVATKLTNWLTAGT